MAQTLTSARKKKLRQLADMMNRQNDRFMVIAPPLLEMMDMVLTDQELDFLLKFGRKMYTVREAADLSGLSENLFRPFFDTLNRKGFIHLDFDESGDERYRLNAIAVGWYEAQTHYLIGKEQEKEFARKFDEFFEFFRKFNVYPVRSIQNIVLRPFVRPSQSVAIHPAPVPGKKSKKIPINTTVAPPETNVWPTSLVTDLIEEFGNQDSIHVFPCVCRHSADLLDRSCRHEHPRESCIAFGDIARTWAGFGYGRHISKEEALDIMQMVREKGAVHSVIHERDNPKNPVVAICNCCWDCCGMLRSYNMGAIPLNYQSHFIAKIVDLDNCKGCGTCMKYCPTTAMAVVDKKAVLNSAKCIGCGQCAYQCPRNNIEMSYNSREVYLPVLSLKEARIKG